MSRRSSFQDPCNAIPLSSLFSSTSALFCATEHSQTLYHQRLAHSLHKNRGVGASLVSSPTKFRTFFYFTYAVSPLFVNLTKTAGVWGHASLPRAAANGLPKAERRARLGSHVPSGRSCLWPEVLNFRLPNVSKSFTMRSCMISRSKCFRMRTYIKLFGNSFRMRTYEKRWGRGVAG